MQTSDGVGYQILRDDGEKWWHAFRQGHGNRRYAPALHLEVTAEGVKTDEQLHGLNNSTSDTSNASISPNR